MKIYTQPISIKMKFEADRIIDLLRIWPVWVCLVVISMGIRIYLAWAYFGNYDQTSYEIVADIMKQGGNVYAETTRYNYTPVWAWCLFFFLKFAQWANLPFHFVVRSFLTIIDLLDGVIIGLIAEWIKPDFGRIAALTYWLNPVSILIVGYHGQFDNFAMLPLLIAFYLLISKQSGKRRNIWIWLLSTSSILIKHITIFSLWTIFLLAFPFTLAIFFAVLSMIAFSLSFVPYAIGGTEGIIRNVFLYTSNSGLYGFGVLFPQIITIPLFFLLMAELPLILKSHTAFSPLKQLEAVFISFLAFAPGIGEQYFLLPVMIGSISPSIFFGNFQPCRISFPAQQPQ